MPINVQASNSEKMRRMVESDVDIQTLRQMTPQELETHIDSMLTLPQLKDLVKQLACVVFSQ